MPEQSKEYKIVVFGAGEVGKTSLILRLIRNTYNETYTPTVEDTYRTVVNSVSNIICTLVITDTAGSYYFPAMHSLSMSRGHAFILVYSVTNRQSLEDLKRLHEQIKQLRGSDLRNIPVCLVGNKCDEEERVVLKKEGEELASSLQCSFLETSAKDNLNVTKLFKTLLSMEKSHELSLPDETMGQSKNKKRKLCKGCLIY